MSAALLRRDRRERLGQRTAHAGVPAQERVARSVGDRVGCGEARHVGHVAAEEGARREIGEPRVAQRVDRTRQPLGAQRTYGQDLVREQSREARHVRAREAGAEVGLREARRERGDVERAIGISNPSTTRSFFVANQTVTVGNTLANVRSTSSTAASSISYWAIHCA